MRLESALYASREGIAAHGQALSVIGDNISNSNTVGFKESRAEFADLFASQMSVGTQFDMPSTGDGVAIGAVRQIFKDGVVEITSRTLDVAISGGGLFILGDPNDPRYSRAGNFTLDPNGNLVSAQGLALLGIPKGGTALAPLNLSQIGEGGVATTTADVTGNLDATSAATTPPANPADFKEIGAAASYAYPSKYYDSLGGAHDVVVYFFKTDTNTWTAQAYIDGAEVGQEAGTPVKIGQDATIRFGNDGKITEDNKAAAVISALAPAYSNGAAPGNFNIDLSGFSQFASPFAITGANQDGLASGNVSKFEILENGDVVAYFDSGTQLSIGTIQLASVTNIDGLDRVGNSMFRASERTGEITTGTPGQGSLGRLQGGALERSNVDLSSEFVDLVLLQRGYQANSQALSAANDLIRDTISLIR